VTPPSLPEWRRLSLLEPRPLSSGELGGGVVAALAIALCLPLVGLGVAAATRAVLDAAGVVASPLLEPEVADPPPVEHIEARFVKLGADLDPRHLPDRYRPSRATAPPPSATPAPSEPAAPPAVTEAPPVTTTMGGVAPPAEPETAPAEEAPPAEPSPPSPTPRRATGGPPTAPADAAEDPLARLGDRADTLSTLARPREREGDPDGIAEGTETRDSADLYPGQLYTYFRRGWRAPSGIPDDELRALSAVVEVELTRDARVGAWRISRGSGHESFDESVRLRMRQAEGAALPSPPADEADRYLGRSIALRFLGRHGR